MEEAGRHAGRLTGGAPQWIDDWRSQHLRRRLRPVPTGAGIHLVLDSTGLSLVGAGEWAAAKHGGRGRRGWRKLHLGVDQSGVIRVHTLTEETGDDATTALDLLNAVEGPLVRVTADAAYDTVAVYETAMARGATVVVPPARTANVSDHGPRPRRRHYPESHPMTPIFLQLAQILQALLTPVIGIAVVYIAWQQWQANTRKLKLEMYDRRRRIYDEVVAFLGLVLRDFKPDIPDVLAFRRATAEADFLFDSEITNYIDEVVKQALSIRVAHLKLTPPGNDHAKVVEAMSEREEWFAGQHDIARLKFRPYLDVSQIK